ncbi:hypothetical protein GCM10009547_48530 [Sporichthya brevicatena]|uniref:Uncharacterized protein n=1 Tax=Sporichthya brevicatena TaxID=171442 RepID=A0ABN1HCT3_9ACTN
MIMRRLGAGAWGVALLLTGCSSGDSQIATPRQTVSGAVLPSPTPTLSPKDVPFALFPDNVPGPGWQFSEAVLPSAEGLEMFGEATPGLVWFAEWDGPDPAESAYLSVTLRRFGLADLDDREPLTAAGSGEIRGRSATWGQAGDGGAGVVRIAWGEGWTLELQGSESVDAMRRFADRLRPANLKQWRAAGGKVGCAPFAEDCD